MPSGKTKVEITIGMKEDGSITLVTKKIESSAKKIAEAFKEAEKSSKGISSNLEKFSQKLSTLNSTFSQMNKSFERINSLVGSLGNRIKSLNTTLGSLQSKFDSLSNSVAKVGRVDNLATNNAVKNANKKGEVIKQITRSLNQEAVAIARNSALWQKLTKEQQMQAVQHIKDSIAKQRTLPTPMLDNLAQRENMLLRQRALQEIPGAVSLFNQRDYDASMASMKAHYTQEVALAQASANQRIALIKQVATARIQAEKEIQATTLASYETFNKRLGATGAFGFGLGDEADKTRAKWSQYYEKGQSRFEKKGFVPMTMTKEDMDASKRLDDLRVKVSNLQDAREKLAKGRVWDREQRDLDGVSKNLGFVIWKVLRLMAAYAAMRVVFGTIRKESIAAFQVTEDYAQQVIKMAALMTTFADVPAGTDPSETYKKALAYSKLLVLEMEKLDMQTIASAKDLDVMVQAFLRGGVQINIYNKKTLEGFRDIANAIKVLTAGFPMQEQQMAQEIRALLNGQARATDMLGMIMRQKLGSAWKDIMVQWRKEGPDVFIQRVAKVLGGFGEASKGFENLWETVKSSLQTIHNIIFRGAFKDLHDTIIQLGKDIQDLFRDRATGALTDFAIKTRNALSSVWLEIKGDVRNIVTLFEKLSGVFEYLTKSAWKLRDTIKEVVLLLGTLWLGKKLGLAGKKMDTGFASGVGAKDVAIYTGASVAVAAFAKQLFTASGRATLLSMGLKGLGEGIKTLGRNIGAWLKGNWILLALMGIVDMIMQITDASNQAAKAIDGIKTALANLSLEELTIERGKVEETLKGLGVTPKIEGKMPELVSRDVFKKRRDDLVKLWETEKTEAKKSEIWNQIQKLDDTIGKRIVLQETIIDLEKKLTKESENYIGVELRGFKKSYDYLKEYGHQLFETYKFVDDVEKEGGVISKFLGKLSLGPGVMGETELGKWQEMYKKAGIKEEDAPQELKVPLLGWGLGFGIADRGEQKKVITKVAEENVKIYLEKLNDLVYGNKVDLSRPSEEDKNDAIRRLKDMIDKWDELRQTILSMGTAPNDVLTLSESVRSQWYDAIQQFRALKDKGKDVSKEFLEMKKHLAVIGSMKVLLLTTRFKETQAEVKELKELIGDTTLPLPIWTKSLEEGTAKLEKQVVLWTGIQEAFEKAAVGDIGDLEAKLKGVLEGVVPTKEFAEAEKKLHDWLAEIAASPETFSEVSKEIGDHLKSLGIDIYELQEFFATQVSNMAQAFLKLRDTFKDSELEFFPEGSFEREAANIEKTMREKISSLVTDLQKDNILSKLIPTTQLAEMFTDQTPIRNIVEGAQMTDEAWRQATGSALNYSTIAKEAIRLASITKPLELKNQELEVLQKITQTLFETHELTGDWTTLELDKVRALELERDMQINLLKLEQAKYESQARLIDARLALGYEDYAGQYDALVKTKEIYEGLVESVGTLIDATETLSNIKIEQEGMVQWKQDLLQYSNQLLYTERNLADAVIQTADTMKSAMMDFFDVTSDGFLDMQKLVEDVLNQILKKMIEVFIINNIIGGFGKLLTGGGGQSSWNAILGSGPDEYHKGGVIGKLDKMHKGGLRNDEEMFIGQIGEGVVSRKGMKALSMINEGKVSSAPSASTVPIEIKIENQGVPVAAEPRGVPRFDGEKYVVSLILKNISEYGALRTAIKGVR